MTKTTPRDAGKPLLQLLDAYVLWAIDELPESNAQSLKEMTPNLRSLYGVEGDWQQIVCAVMDLPRNTPALIKNMWTKNIEIARKNRSILTPEQFAKMFVDRNLIR